MKASFAGKEIDVIDQAEVHTPSPKHITPSKLQHMKESLKLNLQTLQAEESLRLDNSRGPKPAFGNMFSSGSLKHSHTLQSKLATVRAMSNEESSTPSKSYMQREDDSLRAKLRHSKTDGKQETSKSNSTQEEIDAFKLHMTSARPDCITPLCRKKSMPA